MDSVSTERRPLPPADPAPATVKGVLRLVRGPRALARWAVASLVANVVIVLTGALVRLTASGLGCPTWPRCTDSSYVSRPELGIHGAIEFGNRLLAFVLVAIALLTWVAALLHREGGRPRRDLRWLTFGMALGIPAQGVIGGITVLTQLNPFVVALHLLASMVLIGLAVWLVRLTRHLAPRPASTAGVVAARAAFALMVVAVWLGTVVTGSGPHAGDNGAARTGFDGAFVTHLHAVAVYGAVATTVAALWLLRSRAALLLLVVEVLQAALGITQYNLGLPVPLVVLHLLGASLAVAATTNLVLSVHRAPAPAVVPPGFADAHAG